MSGKEEHNEKVLLKLSSLMKFSQNFSAVKVITVAPHHWFVQSLLAFSIPLVWAIVLSATKANARSLPMDKANIVPTPYFFIHINR